MAIASLPIEDMKALASHGHPDMWEVTTYGEGESVTVECARCGMVLLELVDNDRLVEHGLRQPLNAHKTTEGGL